MFAVPHLNTSIRINIIVSFSLKFIYSPSVLTAITLFLFNKILKLQIKIGIFCLDLINGPITYLRN